MKKLLKNIIAISCVTVSLFSFAACNSSAVKPQAIVLGEPKAVTAISYSERYTDKVKTISDSAEKCAAELAAMTYKDYEKSKNFVIAPVSVYMALSLAAQCSSGNTQAEILSAIGVTYEQLSSGFSDYYRSMFNESKRNGETSELTTFTNSIWLDNRFEAKQDCIDILADNYFCYSYKTDFYNENEAANAAVREFVKDKTRGLIDKNFELSVDTLFALINTLYFKSIWNSAGDELSFTNKIYDFVNYDESQTSAKLLQGYYRSGKTYECDTFKTFFTTSYGGNKIKFILPNAGYSVDDIFTSENITKINAIADYSAVDEVNKIKYHTRCLFPEFSVSYDRDIKVQLKKIGINDLFDKDLCNYTALTDDGAYCSRVIHSAKLEVNKSGMEGAAVTIIENAPTSSAPEPEVYENVYYDFIIDKAFGFILTDRYDNTLFSGVIKNI